MHDLETMYRAYFPMIRAKCLRMVRDLDLAEDITQETFVRMWQNQETFKDHEHRVAWIYRTSTNLTIDKLRSRNRLHALSDSVMRVKAHDQAENAEKALITQQWLEQVVNQISERSWQVLMLSRVDGLQQEEMAAILGASSRTIRRWLVIAEEELSALQDLSRSTSSTDSP